MKGEHVGALIGAGLAWLFGAGLIGIAAGGAAGFVIGRTDLEDGYLVDRSQVAPVLEQHVATSDSIVGEVTDDVDAAVDDEISFGTELLEGGQWGSDLMGDFYGGQA